MVGNLNAITARAHEWTEAEQRAARRMRAWWPSCWSPRPGRLDGPPIVIGVRSMSARIDPAALAASMRRLREPPSQVLKKSLDYLVTACVELFGVGGSGLMLADGGGDLRHA